MVGLRTIFRNLGIRDIPESLSQVHGSSTTRVNYKPHFYYRQAPAWIPDSKVSHCVGCRRGFAFLFRKHHCRRCGQIFCDDCSDNRYPLRRMRFTGNVRQCEKCLIDSRIEHNFMKDFMGTLEKGAPFLVCSSQDRAKATYDARSEPDNVLRVFIDPSHRSIAFSSDCKRSLPVLNSKKVERKAIGITRIISIDRTQVPQVEQSTGDSIQGPALSIRYYNDQKDVKDILIVAIQDSETFEIQANWVHALTAACYFMRSHVL